MIPVGDLLVHLVRLVRLVRLEWVAPGCAPKMKQPATVTGKAVQISTPTVAK